MIGTNIDTYRQLLTTLEGFKNQSQLVGEQFLQQIDPVTRWKLEQKAGAAGVSVADLWTTLSQAITEYETSMSARAVSQSAASPMEGAFAPSPIATTAFRIGQSVFAARGSVKEASERIRLNPSVAPTTPVLRPCDLSAVKQARVEDALSAMRELFPKLPVEVVKEEPGISLDGKVLKEGTATGEVFQYTLFTGPGDKTAVIAELQKRLGAEFNVRDGGAVINVFSSKIDKRSVVNQLASQLGISPDDMYKFGDKPPPAGNDNFLGNDERSFVGTGTATLKAELARLLDQKSLFEKSQPPVLVVSSGVVTCKIDGKTRIDPDVAKLLSDYMSRGGHLIVLTGRGANTGPGLFQDLAQQSGVAENARNATVCLFNGGLCVSGQALLTAP